MNEIKVNMREKKEYVSDDSRRIEMWTVVGELPYTPKDEDAAKEFLVMPQTPAFYGILTVGTPNGPREIKFEITEVNTIQEAFAKYSDVAKEVVAELQQQYQEMMKKMQEEQQQKIITAPAGTLNNLKLVTGE